MKQGWEIKKLGEVCEIINGFAFKSQLFKDCGDDILRISNIQNGVIDDSDIAHFSKNDYPKVDFDKYTVFPNDIIVALSGATTGKFGINNTGRKLYLNQRVAICREKTNDVHHRFLLYFLKTQSKSFLESAAGVAQPNLSTEQMKLYEIPIPPLAEQEKIVEELDCLSGIIEKKKQQLKEYDALAQSIFYEMFGDPIINEKGWEVKKLSDAVSIDCPISYGIVQPMDDVEGGIPIVRPIDLVDTFVRKDNLKRTSVDISNAYKRTILRGDEILMCVRGTTGVVSMASDELKGCNTTRGIVPLFFDSINRWFVYYLIKQPSMQCLIAENTYGIALKQINIKELRLLPIITPPLALQQEFALKIEAIEKQKELLKQSIAETETLFNSRMDYYFN